MGVLNATPDSFYAGSRVPQSEEAVARAEAMVKEGADILDIGGESTRPGAAPVSLAVELSRVIPVVEALHQTLPDCPLSVDTQKAEVARQALARGARWVNDISALRHDPEMASVIADSGCPVVLMHMRGTPETMQQNPQYQNVMDELKVFFEERLAAAVRAGIAEVQVVLDPGIGFGKTLEHNVTILSQLSRLKVLGRPLLVGISRKSFVGRLFTSPPFPLLIGEGRPLQQNPLPSGEGGPPQAVGEVLPPEERLPGTLAATLWALQQGADGVRVHDVGATRQAITAWQALAS